MTFPALGIVLQQDAACQQHPDRLAADVAAADHACADLNEVLQAEIAAGERDDALVAADQDRIELLEHSTASLAVGVLVQHLGGIEKETIPIVELALRGLAFAPLEVRVESGRVAAVDHGAKRLALVNMRQEHGRRLALPDLDRLQVAAAFGPSDIDQNLRGLADACHGGVAVAAREQAEIGNRVEPIKVGTDDLEEIADHQVGGPGREQIGETVEDVEGAASVVRDQAVDVAGEGLEAAQGVDRDDLDARSGRDQGRMSAEAQIDDGAIACDGLRDKGLDEAAVVLDVVDAPDDVVADAQAVEDAIESGESGRDALGAGDLEVVLHRRDLGRQGRRLGLATLSGRRRGFGQLAAVCSRAIRIRSSAIASMSGKPLAC